MTIKCLIVDDEPLARRVIEKHLDYFDNFEVIGQSEDATEAFNFLQKKQVDLMFLDINMPLMNGFDLLKSLNTPPKVIITSAYREYAVESYELNVLDYLVKPIGFSRFTKSIEKVNIYYETTNVENDNKENHIFVKTDKKMIRVNFEDIFYIESLKDYIKIVTANGAHITHQNLTGISKILPANHFLRIHRSFTVNMTQIKTLEGNFLEIGGKQLPIGRNFQKEVKNLILKRSLED